MNEGIYVNGAHSYGTHKLRCIKRNIGEPKKDDYTERVPFSNIVYDFGGLYGEQTYGERPLTYTFEFMCFHKKKAQDRIVNVKEWLKWIGSQTLYDDLMPDYHFQVRSPNVSWSENHGVYTITVSFPAAPEMWENSNKIPAPIQYVVPDINGDGKVDAADATMILEAYQKIMVGEDTGLTEEQLDACDANRDGLINAADASLVLEYYSYASIGRYGILPQGWTEFMQDREQGVI